MKLGLASKEAGEKYSSMGDRGIFDQIPYARSLVPRHERLLRTNSQEESFGGKRTPDPALLS